MGIAVRHVDNSVNLVLVLLTVLAVLMGIGWRLVLGPTVLPVLLDVKLVVRRLHAQLVLKIVG